MSLDLSHTHWFLGRRATSWDPSRTRWFHDGQRLWTCLTLIGFFDGQRLGSRLVLVGLVGYR